MTDTLPRYTLEEFVRMNRMHFSDPSPGSCPLVGPTRERASARICAERRQSCIRAFAQLMREGLQDQITRKIDFFDPRASIQTGGLAVSPSRTKKEVHYGL